MPSELRELGSSGLRLSTVGVGTWAMGGSGWSGSWGDQEDAKSISAINAALDEGANWIDTAPVYGLGHAEEVVGRAISALHEADRPLVFTKCGFEWDPANPEDIWQSLSPKRIRTELEDSLRRLELDHVDLFQFHWPDMTSSEDNRATLEESWATMAELVKEGKTRAIGVSNFSVEQLERCEAVRHVDSVQPPFSLIGRTAASKVIPWALEHKTGVLAYSPMQSGLLTDRASIEWANQFAEEDWRRTAPEFSSPRFERNLALRDALKPIAARRESNVASVAIAWVLSVPGVTAAIVGGRTEEQVRGWVGAGRVKLTDEDLREIDAALSATGAGDDWSVYPNPVEG